MLTKDKSTPENREYWEFVEGVAAEVRTWPDWKTGGRKMEESKACPMCDGNQCDYPNTAEPCPLCKGTGLARATADEAARCSRCDDNGYLQSEYTGATADCGCGKPRTDRAEKEPLAERPQGVDVEKLRTDLALYHGLGARNITALLDELERVRGDLDVYRIRGDEDKAIRLNAAAQIDSLEQRLRIAGDPDGAEREALRARVAELERILSAERAEYDWAVKGAKALEAKLARAQNVVRVSSMDAGTKTHLLTILNGGTN